MVSTRGRLFVPGMIPLGSPRIDSLMTLVREVLEIAVNYNHTVKVIPTNRYDYGLDFSASPPRGTRDQYRRNHRLSLPEYVV